MITFSKMSKHKNLENAKKAKNDEFYTLYEDIENELQYYTEHLKDKIIYCNCDDYEKSNFYKYFKDNFKKLQLKELIATGYDNITNKQGKYARYNGETEITKNNVEGDFMKNINLLKEADIIITNPPFSIYNNYLNLLIEHNKKFLFIANQTTISWKHTFTGILNKKFWLGYNYDTIKYFYNNNNNKVSLSISTIWFTNLKHKDNDNDITLTKIYNENEYKKYDNYNAINVDKIKDIPKDYKGLMGIPISGCKFMKTDGTLKLNGEKYKVLCVAAGSTKKNTPKDILEYVGFVPNIHTKNNGGGDGLPIINGIGKYSRLIIEKQHT